MFLTVYMFFLIFFILYIFLACFLIRWPIVCKKELQKCLFSNRLDSSENVFFQDFYETIWYCSNSYKLLTTYSIFSCLNYHDDNYTMITPSTNNKWTTYCQLIARYKLIYFCKCMRRQQHRYSLWLILHLYVRSYELDIHI